MGEKMHSLWGEKEKGRGHQFTRMIGPSIGKKKKGRGHARWIALADLFVGKGDWGEAAG